MQIRFTAWCVAVSFEMAHIEALSQPSFCAGPIWRILLTLVRPTMYPDMVLTPLDPFTLHFDYIIRIAPS
jgi:hypothetical protein